MHKLFRLYNQNRIKVWSIIIAIIFAITIIQILNSVAKEKNKKTVEEEETTSKNVVSYTNESESIISEGSVLKEYQNDFGRTIDEFFKYCVSHQPELAYDMLSEECKKILYPSKESFENLYYKNKFEGNKEYSFKSWSRVGNTYIYLVKIYDNMLATGKDNSSYIEDYVTITDEQEGYKLNVNSFIGRNLLNVKEENQYLSTEVAIKDMYMDYEIYTFRIKNNTDKTILLDTRKKTNTTFVTDHNNVKYESYLYENKEQDLILNPKESKTIQIKFSNRYKGNTTEKISFTDIVLDYNEYINNQDVERFQMQINL